MSFGLFRMHVNMAINIPQKDAVCHLETLSFAAIFLQAGSSCDGLLNKEKSSPNFS